MLLAWAVDDGPVRVWDATAKPLPPAYLVQAVNQCDEVWAHNSHFDRTVLSHALPHLCPPLAKWRDTMVQALSHGLPGALGQLCEILKLPTDVAKDKEGRRFIQLFCKPRNSIIKRATSETHPAEWERFIEYASLDVEAMREVHKRLPTWNYKGAELDLWHLDQRINDRGVEIDMELVHGAIAAVAQAKVALDRQAVEMTAGDVAATTQRALMLDHIAERYGVILSDLQMSTVERVVADEDADPALRALLEVRLQASTTSTAKYRTLARGTSADNRLRGTLQFNGASRTGRWAGRLFQPQNLPRPTLKQEQIDSGIAALKAGCADLITDNVMQLTSSAIRSCIVAPIGKKLVVADLANIEGRVQAWLCGEEWKLQAFREYDTGSGPDLYKLAYSKAFGIEAEAVDKDQRQIGKVMELALAYAGGVGAFTTFATAFAIDLDALAEKMLPVAPDWAVSEAENFYVWMLKSEKVDGSMSERAFVACDTLKRMWRQAHPGISSHWKELEDACREAIEHPSVTITCRKVKIRRDGAWLRVVLPSGRAICYPAPQLDETGVITHMGTDQFSRRFCRLSTYGGKIFENICQAVARDVMSNNMGPIDGAGYDIGLTVHDELITETPDTPQFSSEDLSVRLGAPPPWALDMPLAAAGFETYAYRKD
jgi:DNA polymerase